MLDIKFIRENVDAVKKAIVQKGLTLDIAELIAVDEKRRTVMQKSESLRSEQKKTEDREKATALKAEFKELEAELELIEKEYMRLMAQVPNIPSEDTPVGKDGHDNVEVFSSGDLPKFDFEPKDHIALAKRLNVIDFERGAKVAGYRGYYLKNEGAQLALALMMFALNKMIAKGYQPMIPPTLVKGAALFGSGYFKGLEYDPAVDEIYEIASQDRNMSGEQSKEKKFLVGTAEPSLLAYYGNEIVKEDDLPIRIAGFSQCYRSEIGSYGKDTKGLYRVHEFMKVEQVVITTADVADSDKLQQEMTQITREIHADLGLPFRQIQICTGDMGLGKYKMFDTEVWLPGSRRWAETGSASNFLDWQARRLNIRYTTKSGEKKFAYLLNNTALPTPRPLIAILENYQTKDGTIKIPEVLIPYMGGKKEIV
ncbi:MAG: serine--tRNA ligase [Patescibacteria group bacterium]